jgi:outer membrane protein assembly factor BamC
LINIFFKKSAITAAILVSFTLTGCARFSERVQADDEFNYQDSALVAPYKTGNFTNNEARVQFELPVLTPEQVQNGFAMEDVDIRPPNEFMPIIDGVILIPNPTETNVLFTATKSGDDVQQKITSLLTSYFAMHEVDIINKSNLQIETPVYNTKTIFRRTFYDNVISIDTSYRLTLQPQTSAHSVMLNVDLLSYSETNNDKPLKFKMTTQRKKNIEVNFVNDVLNFAYQKNQTLEKNSLNTQPLTIKLGFDDNHQNIWIAENNFVDTWNKMENLLQLLHFEVLETDRNLGYFVADYSVPDKDYWEENKLNPFELKYGKYYIQLGEIDDNNTSISWLDSKKKPIGNQKVTDMYLSITDQIRSVLLKKDQQPSF